MRLTPYALSLIAKHEQRTPADKRRAYKREWTRKRRAMAGGNLSEWRMTEPSKALNAG